MTEKEKAASPEKKAALEAIRDQFKGTDSKTQCNRLLEALRRFGLTSFEAMRYLDVYYAPARILMLRRQGFEISTHWQTIATESGELHRVGYYVLESEVDHV